MCYIDPDIEEIIEVYISKERYNNQNSLSWY